MRLRVYSPRRLSRSGESSSTDRESPSRSKILPASCLPQDALAKQPVSGLRRCDSEDKHAVFGQAVLADFAPLQSVFVAQNQVVGGRGERQSGGVESRDFRASSRLVKGAREQIADLVTRYDCRPCLDLENL